MLRRWFAAFMVGLLAAVGPVGASPLASAAAPAYIPAPPSVTLGALNSTPGGPRTFTAQLQPSDSTYAPQVIYYSYEIVSKPTYTPGDQMYLFGQFLPGAAGSADVKSLGLDLTQNWYLMVAAVLSENGTVDNDHAYGTGFGEPVLFYPGSNPQPPFKCPPFKLFGVRGSGEKWSDYGGFGKTIASFKDRLASKIPGLATEALDYPAIPVDFVHPTYPANYAESERKGKEALVAHAEQFTASCAHTYIVFAGFSQGAGVARAAFLDLPDSLKKHVADVVLFGNPYFNPRQPAVDIGDFNPKLSGIFSLTSDKIPGRWTSRVDDYCTDGDPICNDSTRNLASCIGPLKDLLCAHLRYAERHWTVRAADAALSSWKALPRLK